MKKNSFNHFAKKMLFGACLCMAVAAFDINTYSVTKAYAQEQSDLKYYEGKVNHGVNVRVAAGADQEQLKSGEKGVSLKAGTSVVILDSVDVNGKIWYHIRFTYNEQEMEGYSTSTYIDKTDVVITPTPLPTPTPQPTPVPTQKPTIAPTKVPVATEVPAVSQDSETSGDEWNKTPLLIALAVGVVGIIGIVIYLVKKNEKENQVLSNSEVARKVDNLKNMVKLSENERAMKKSKSSTPEDKKKADNTKQDRVKADKAHTDAQLRREVEERVLKQEQEAVLAVNGRQEESIKVLKRNRMMEQAELNEHRQDVYVLAQNEEDSKPETGILFGSEEDMELNEKERKELRLAVNRLREHDIVIHKYFGKGEVYDNSDVRLIEIRFQGDARFLNKDQLVNKHLIKITNERSI